MADYTEAGRNAQLVIELASGTAVVNGEELELPLREFRLLAELARRVGEPISTAELIEKVWPDEPWTPKENLYILVTRLRRLIDGERKFGKNIRNRRGFGYLLDLPPEDVRVVDRAHTPSATPTADRPAPLAAAGDEEAPEATEETTEPDHVQTRSRLRGALVPVVVGTVLVATSWSAGYVLSSRSSGQVHSDARDHAAVSPAAPDDPAEPRSDAKLKREARARKSSEPDRRSKKRTRSRARGARISIAAPSQTQHVATQQPDPASPRPGAQKSKTGDGSKPDAPPPAPALPPAPTRYLYHLVSEKTGDHFVTTDANTASEYEAMGFVGGPIGRVYTAPENGAKAIPTNHGTAYIFASSSPRTEPASRPVALWYATNGSGDFFYTTNRSEATAGGWQSQVVGYVRSL